ncbi:hypothetical protein [Candidatus Williamhamiltonella defendens]|uniref:hypothetical protein n=1 Tax=Candidatus Williamhamiltonella defendens TaxID=138072 RepID=UPI001C9E08AB|nr:hypothetical protein [Candidatus Hamiltonella defensa]
MNKIFRLPALDGLNVKIQQKLRTSYMTMSRDCSMLCAQINMSRGGDFVLNSFYHTKVQANSVYSDTN